MSEHYHNTRLVLWNLKAKLDGEAQNARTEIEYHESEVRKYRLKVQALESEAAEVAKAAKTLGGMDAAALVVSPKEEGELKARAQLEPEDWIKAC